MTAHQQHCGAVVPAVVRSILDGHPEVGERLLSELNPHAALHALYVAVTLASDLASCLNRLEPGHGDADIQRFALRLNTAEQADAVLAAARAADEE